LLCVVIDAQLALNPAPRDEIRLREEQFALAKQIEEEVRKKIEIGAAAPGDELLPRYRRLTAECDLLRVKHQVNAR